MPQLLARCPRWLVCPALCVRTSKLRAARTAIVSAPTPPFQLAGFFDPDAPARPIRIALPIDTSPAGLRKFDKNTVFMVSDILCGQIDRVKALNLGDLVRSVLPWPFHKELSVPDTGPVHDPNNPSLSLRHALFAVRCRLSRSAPCSC